jgi:hypothetical protein
MMRTLLAMPILVVCSCGSVSGGAPKTVDAKLPQLVVSPMTLTIPEGTTKTFDVLLDAEPMAPMTVNIASTNATALPISMSSITFTGGTGGNWSIPTQVMVSPPIDKNAVSETATINLGDTGSTTSVDISATAQDTTTLKQYGWPTQFTDGLGITGNTLVAFQVTLDADTTLDTFGIINRIDVRDSLYRMALYRDGGGRPGALFASMAAPAALAVGLNVFDLQPDLPIDTINTPAGRTFWLAIETSMGINTRSSPTVMTSRCVMAVTNITDPWPVGFDPTKCGTAAAINIWMDTYHQ